MAWHEGKPEYRSSPNSKEVRENFAYLKALADLLSGAGVTDADLEKLHALTISASSVNNLPLGYLQRSKFTYVDADTITIGPGVYHHSGTTDQIVYWNSTLTFNSTDTGSQWYYLYIDDSAIVTAGTNLLTASEFINSTTAPTWSDAKHGWYHGNNRCIFAYQVGSGSICEFSHDGGDSVSTVTNAVTSTPTLYPGIEKEVDLSLSSGRPGFCSKLDLYVNITPRTVASTVYVYQFSGKSQLGIHFKVPASSTSTLDIELLLAGIQLSADMSLYYLSSLENYAGTYSHYQITGWHFPAGM